MAICVSRLTNYLSELNWSYKSAQDDRILTSFQINDGQIFFLTIELDEEGEYILFRVPHLLRINNSDYQDIALQTMASIAYELKMVRLEYCPVYGEVLVSIELPLEDNYLTQKQFNRCLLTLVDSIEKVILPRLTSVITTGKDLGMPHHLIPDRMIDYLIQYLYQAIAKRRQKNINS